MHPTHQIQAGFCAKRVLAPRSYIAVAPAVFLFIAQNSIAQSWGTATPPEDYDRIGPHLLLTAGASSSLYFRDLLVDRQLAGRAGIAATYRGFSMSLMAANSANSRPAFTESSFSYSYKFPLIDAHVGMGTWSLHTDRQRLTSEHVRIGLSTNAWESLMLDLDYQRSSRYGAIMGASIVSPVGSIGANRFFVKLSHTTWNRHAERGDGASLRAFGVLELTRTANLQYYVGYMDSRVPAAATPRKGFIAGLSMLWEMQQ